MLLQRPEHRAPEAPPAGEKQGLPWVVLRYQHSAMKRIPVLESGDMLADPFRTGEKLWASGPVSVRWELRADTLAGVSGSLGISGILSQMRAA